MVNEGYLIVKKSEIAFETYTNEADKLTALSYYLDRFRELMSIHFTPANYKGISRYPIVLNDVVPHYIVDEDVCEDTIFVKYETAVRIFQQLEKRNEHEIIKIFLPKKIDNSDNLLGYDIGYFGGECFSIICDSIVMPRWHPPVLEDLEILTKQTERLNKNMLFSDKGLAQEFYDYYIEQEWAEKPLCPGQIQIIGVSYI